MWRMQDMAEGFFLRLRLHLWAQAEPNVFITSCEFKVFRLIHKVSVPKSAPPSLYIGSPMHPPCAKASPRTHTSPFERALFAPKGAGGVPFCPRERKKQWPLAEKSTVFRRKQPTFSATSTTFAPTALRLGAKKSKKSNIAPSPLPKIGESCTGQKAKLKRKLRQAIEFLFLSRKRLFVFTASNRNKRRKAGARPKVCVPLG